MPVALSEVALKVPFAPSALGAAASTIGAAPAAEASIIGWATDGDADLAKDPAAGAEASRAGASTVAVSVPVCASFRVVTGVPLRHSGRSGVVSAQAGRAVRRRREPQLPP